MYLADMRLARWRCHRLVKDLSPNRELYLEVTPVKVFPFTKYQQFQRSTILYFHHHLILLNEILKSIGNIGPKKVTMRSVLIASFECYHLYDL